MPEEKSTPGKDAQLKLDTDQMVTTIVLSKDEVKITGRAPVRSEDGKELGVWNFDLPNGPADALALATVLRQLAGHLVLTGVAMTVGDQFKKLAEAFAGDLGKDPGI